MRDLRLIEELPLDRPPTPMAIRPAGFAGDPLMHHRDARALDEVPEAWGYGDKLTLTTPPPPLERLQAFRTLVLAGLAPAGQEAGIKAAMMLLESFPQADRTGTLYAQAVATRLAECPEDLMMPVLTAILDTMTYRPSASEVKDAVSKATAGRKLLLMRCDAGLRWHNHQADCVVASGAPQITVEQAHELVAYLKAPPMYERSHPPEAAVIPPTRPRPAPLSGEALRAARHAAKMPDNME